MIKIKKIELLAPAGNMESLHIALLYGADAVYIGGQNYSLRANAKNFTLEEIASACEYAHRLGKKVFVTVNIVFHNEDIIGLTDYLKHLAKFKVDAIIVSDPLVINIVKKNKIKLPIYLSTQYSTVNYEAVKFWKSQGIKRIILGRELSKEEIREIIDKTGMEVEIFIHGAMCAAYSGRCVLSNYFTNRDANRGGCAQICRWNFTLTKDEKTSYQNFTMCSKDLCMLKYIDQIIDLGIASVKVEGRMRGIYYIATVISIYRQIIDAHYNHTLTPKKYEYYTKVLSRVANRDNIPQFFDHFPGIESQYFKDTEVSNQDYLALVDSYQNGYVYLIVKNYFKVGDEVEIMSFNKEVISFKVPQLYDCNLNPIECARHPEEMVLFKLNQKVSQYDMLRTKIK